MGRRRKPEPDEEPDDDDPVAPAEYVTTGRKKGDSYPVKRPAIDKARHLPFPEWAARFLKIRDENGVLMPFELRDTQRRFNDVLEEEMQTQGYVRIIVLKARKEGISSVVQGRAVRDVTERPGWQAGVMAHEDKSCAAIFGRARTMAENLPPDMRRTANKWNKKEIAYKPPHDSALEVNVAKGRGGWARGSDKHFVHLSEMAFWPIIRGESMAQGQLNAIANSVPRVPGTVVIIESTANGAGNQFHRLWKDAVDHKNGFRPVFFGWQDFPQYRLVGKTPDDFPALPEWTRDEAHLRSIGIDEEQLAWRRWKIAADCGGDIDSFKQEYPSYPEEAFLATGTPVFQTSLVQERVQVVERREKARPTKKWAFDAKGVPHEEAGGELRMWRERGEGDLFKDPDRLVITADPAGSGASAPNPQKGDPCCAYVWDRAVDEQVAELHGWIEPDDFADRLYALGQFYKFPLLIVEAGAYGGHVISNLQDLGYPRLYFRERWGDQLLNAPTNWGQLGWITSGKTKQIMVDALRQMWNDRRIVVNSLECLSEHLTFIKNGVKREAQSGAHDDRVMASAIYAAWALEHPYTAPQTERTYTRPDNVWDYFGCHPEPEASTKPLRIR